MSGADCAVVIGGSLAGLMAATAAAEHFGQVIVIERDRFPDGPQARRGVPQGRQLHGLLGRGARAMDGLYPGLIGELQAAGAVPFDVLDDVDWYMDGRRLARSPTGLVNYGFSRPLIDHLILRRVADRPGIRITEGVAVRGLVGAAGSITGVRAAPARLQAKEDVIETDQKAANMLVPASSLMSPSVAFRALATRV